MKIHEPHDRELRGLAEHLKGLRTAMVTLRDGLGRLGARPLTPVEMDAEGALWFMVSRQSMAPLLAPAEQPVNVAFSDEGRSLFVSIAGQARLVDDAARKQALWTAMARPWFSGAEDPDLVLLCVRPMTAEIWDGPDSGVARALAFAASVVAARPIGLGAHEVVRPGTAAASQA